MRQGDTIHRVREALRKGQLPAKFTGKDLVRIGIPKGTAWTFLFKHCDERGEEYEAFRKYFCKNADGTYSLLEEHDMTDSENS